MKLGINVRQVGQMINVESITGELTMINTPEGGAVRGAEQSLTSSRSKSSASAVIVLFLASYTSDSEPIALGREAREIQERLREAAADVGFDVKHEFAVRSSEIDAALLRHHPTVVHFSGHGAPCGGILLEDSRQRSMLVRPADFARMFGILKSGIRCVVLNVCYSEAQARALCEHIDCVVGMAAPINDESARAFSSSYYQALGCRASVKTAFELARARIAREGFADADVPRLYVRDGVDAATVVLV